MGWTARCFSEGDEEPLVRLWNDVYSEYGGFIPRTAAFWTQHILERPGISPEDIVLIEYRGTVRGYGVLGRRGTVLEFAVDSRLSKRSRRRACNLLIEALEQRARQRGEKYLNVVAPVVDRTIDQTLRNADYACTDRFGIGVGILNAKRLLQMLLQRSAGRLPRDCPKTFSLEIQPGCYQVSPYDHLSISFSKDGPVVDERQRESHIDSGCRITIDLGTLTEVVFNHLSFDQATRDKRIRLDDGSSYADAEAFFSLLKIDAPLFWPPSDVF